MSKIRLDDQGIVEKTPTVEELAKARKEGKSKYIPSIEELLKAQKEGKSKFIPADQLRGNSTDYIPTRDGSNQPEDEPGYFENMAARFSIGMDQVQKSAYTKLNADSEAGVGIGSIVEDLFGDKFLDNRIEAQNQEISESSKNLRKLNEDNTPLSISNFVQKGLDYVGNDLAELVGSSAGLIGASIGGGIIGSAIAPGAGTVAGISSFAGMALGASIGRYTESLAEAGDAYTSIKDELIEKNKKLPPAEKLTNKQINENALKGSDEVFNNNMKLLVLDIPAAMISFGIGQKLVTNFVRNSTMRVAAGELIATNAAARTAAGISKGLTVSSLEGAEEGLQYYFQEQAKARVQNEKYDPSLAELFQNEEFRESVKGGFILGGLMNGAGSVYNKISDIKNGISSPAIAKKFQQDTRIATMYDMLERGREHELSGWIKSWTDPAKGEYAKANKMNPEQAKEQTDQFLEELNVAKKSYYGIVNNFAPAERKAAFVNQMNVIHNENEIKKLKDVAGAEDQVNSRTVLSSLNASLNKQVTAIRKEKDPELKKALVLKYGEIKDTLNLASLAFENTYPEASAAGLTLLDKEGRMKAVNELKNPVKEKVVEAVLNQEITVAEGITALNTVVDTKTETKETADDKKDGKKSILSTLTFEGVDDTKEEANKKKATTETKEKVVVKKEIDISENVTSEDKIEASVKKVRKIEKGIEHVNEQETSFTTEEDLDKLTGTSETDVSDFDGSFKVKSRSSNANANITIKDGFLTQEETVTNVKGEEVRRNSRKIPVREMTDKDGNRYLVAFEKPEEKGSAEGRFISGIGYLIPVSEDGKVDAKNVVNFYAQRKEKNKSNIKKGKIKGRFLYDDFESVKKELGLTAKKGTETKKEEAPEVEAKPKPKPTTKKDEIQQSIELSTDQTYVIKGKAYRYVKTYNNRSTIFHQFQDVNKPSVRIKLKTEELTQVSVSKQGDLFAEQSDLDLLKGKKGIEKHDILANSLERGETVTGVIKGTSTPEPYIEFENGETVEIPFVYSFVEIKENDPVYLKLNVPGEGKEIHLAGSLYSISTFQDGNWMWLNPKTGVVYKHNIQVLNSKEEVAGNVAVFARQEKVRPSKNAVKNQTENRQAAAKAEIKKTLLQRAEAWLSDLQERKVQLDKEIGDGKNLGAVSNQDKIIEKQVVSILIGAGKIFIASLKQYGNIRSALLRFRQNLETNLPKSLSKDEKKKLINDSERMLSKYGTMPGSLTDDQKEALSFAIEELNRMAGIEFDGDENDVALNTKFSSAAKMLAFQNKIKHLIYSVDGMDHEMKLRSLMEFSQSISIADERNLVELYTGENSKLDARIKQALLEYEATPENIVSLHAYFKSLVPYTWMYLKNPKPGVDWFLDIANRSNVDKKTEEHYLKNFTSDFKDKLLATDENGVTAYEKIMTKWKEDREAIKTRILNTKNKWPAKNYLATVAALSQSKQMPYSSYTPTQIGFRQLDAIAKDIEEKYHVLFDKKRAAAKSEKEIIEINTLQESIKTKLLTAIKKDQEEAAANLKIRATEMIDIDVEMFHQISNMDYETIRSVMDFYSQDRNKKSLLEHLQTTVKDTEYNDFLFKVLDPSTNRYKQRSDPSKKMGYSAYNFKSPKDWFDEFAISEKNKLSVVAQVGKDLAKAENKIITSLDFVGEDDSRKDAMRFLSHMQLMSNSISEAANEKRFQENEFVQDHKDKPVDIKFISGIANPFNDKSVVVEKFSPNDLATFLYALYRAGDKSFSMPLEQFGDGDAKALVTVKKYTADDARVILANKFGYKVSKEEIKFWEDLEADLTAKGITSGVGHAEDFALNYALNKMYLDEYYQDTEAFKKNGVIDYTKQVKRAKTIASPGIQLVNVEGGIYDMASYEPNVPEAKRTPPGKHNVAIFNDPKITIEIAAGLESAGIKFEESELFDGFTFHSEEFDAAIEKSAGNLLGSQKNGLISGITKFIYSDNDPIEGRVVIKTGSIVLSKAFVDSAKGNNTLKQIYDYMKANQIHRFTFNSSAKVMGTTGQLLNKATWDSKGNLFRLPSKVNKFQADSSKLLLQQDLTNETAFQKDKSPVQVFRYLANFASFDTISQKYQDLMEKTSAEIEEIIDNLESPEWKEKLLDILEDNPQNQMIRSLLANPDVDRSHPVIKSMEPNLVKSILRKSVFDRLANKSRMIEMPAIGVSEKLKGISITTKLDGTKTISPPQAMVSIDYKDQLIEKGNKKFLFIIRVPTTGPHSITLSEVVGFLPSEMKNTIITDPATQKKSGSDNDGDARYAMSKFLNPKKGSSEAIANDIVDLMITEWTNVENYDYLNAPIDTGAVVKTLNEVKAELGINQNSNRLDPFRASSLITMFRNNNDAKIGIGYAATFNAFHQFAKRFKFTLKTPITISTSDYEGVSFSHEKSNVITETYESESVVSLAQVLKEYTLEELKQGVNLRSLQDKVLKGDEETIKDAYNYLKANEKVQLLKKEYDDKIEKNKKINNEINFLTRRINNAIPTKVGDTLNVYNDENASDYKVKVLEITKYNNYAILKVITAKKKEYTIRVESDGSTKTGNIDNFVFNGTKENVEKLRAEKNELKKELNYVKDYFDYDDAFKKVWKNYFQNLNKTSESSVSGKQIKLQIDSEIANTTNIIVDNANLQLMDELGLSVDTISPFMTLQALGFPLKDIIKYFYGSVPQAYIKFMREVNSPTNDAKAKDFWATQNIEDPAVKEFKNLIDVSNDVTVLARIVKANEIPITNFSDFYEISKTLDSLDDLKIQLPGELMFGNKTSQTKEHPAFAPLIKSLKMIKDYWRKSIYLSSNMGPVLTRMQTNERVSRYGYNIPDKKGNIIPMRLTKKQTAAFTKAVDDYVSQRALNITEKKSVLNAEAIEVFERLIKDTDLENVLAIRNDKVELIKSLQGKTLILEDVQRYRDLIKELPAEDRYKLLKMHIANFGSSISTRNGGFMSLFDNETQAIFSQKIAFVKNALLPTAGEERNKFYKEMAMNYPDAISMSALEMRQGKLYNPSIIIKREGEVIKGDYVNFNNVPMPPIVKILNKETGNYELFEHVQKNRYSLLKVVKNNTTELFSFAEQENYKFENQGIEDVKFVDNQEISAASKPELLNSAYRPFVVTTFNNKIYSFNSIWHAYESWKKGYKENIHNDPKWNNNLGTGNQLKKQNVFTVKPIQAADKKAIVKASVANKYIGFAEGIAGSSTGNYAKQIEQQYNLKPEYIYKTEQEAAFDVEDKNIKTGTIIQIDEEGYNGLFTVSNPENDSIEFNSVNSSSSIVNSGSYSSNDVVFVSIGGKRGDAIIRKQQQDKTIKEALTAIEAGATLITDNKAYVESSDYNEGEKRLAKNLEAKKYNYSEKIVDGQTLGVWTKENKNSETSQETDTVNNVETMEKLLRLSFEQNPAAVEALLATGKSKFNYTNSTPFWNGKMNELLDKIKKEYQSKVKNQVESNELLANTNPQLDEAIRARLAEVFPNVQIFTDREAFQKFVDANSENGYLDADAIGAALKNGVFIDPTKARQSTAIHEHAHIYWDMLPSDDRTKLKILQFVKEAYPELPEESLEEQAIQLIGEAGVSLAKLQLSPNMFARWKGMMEVFWKKVKAFFSLQSNQDRIDLLANDILNVGTKNNSQGKIKFQKAKKSGRTAGKQNARNIGEARRDLERLRAKVEMLNDTVITFRYKTKEERDAFEYRYKNTIVEVVNDSADKKGYFVNYRVNHHYKIDGTTSYMSNSEARRVANPDQYDIPYTAEGITIRGSVDSDVNRMSLDMRAKNIGTPVHNFIENVFGNGMSIEDAYNAAMNDPLNPLLPGTPLSALQDLHDQLKKKYFDVLEEQGYENHHEQPVYSEAGWAGTADVLSIRQDEFGLVEGIVSDFKTSDSNILSSASYDKPRGDRGQFASKKREHQVQMGSYAKAFGEAKDGLVGIPVNKMILVGIQYIRNKAGEITGFNVNVDSTVIGSEIRDIVGEMHANLEDNTREGSSNSIIIDRVRYALESGVEDSSFINEAINNMIKANNFLEATKEKYGSYKITQDAIDSFLNLGGGYPTTLDELAQGLLFLNKQVGIDRVAEYKEDGSLTIKETNGNFWTTMDPENGEEKLKEFLRRWRAFEYNYENYQKSMKGLDNKTQLADLESMTYDELMKIYYDLSKYDSVAFNTYLRDLNVLVTRRMTEIQMNKEVTKQELESMPDITKNDVYFRALSDFTSEHPMVQAVAKEYYNKMRAAQSEHKQIMEKASELGKEVIRDYMVRNGETDLWNRVKNYISPFVDYQKYYKELWDDKNENLRDSKDPTLSKAQSDYLAYLEKFKMSPWIQRMLDKRAPKKNEGFHLQRDTWETYMAEKKIGGVKIGVLQALKTFFGNNHYVENTKIWVKNPITGVEELELLGNHLMNIEISDVSLVKKGAMIASSIQQARKWKTQGNHQAVGGGIGDEIGVEEMGSTYTLVGGGLQQMHLVDVGARSLDRNMKLKSQWHYSKPKGLKHSLNVHKGFNQFVNDMLFEKYLQGYNDAGVKIPSDSLLNKILALQGFAQTSEGKGRGKKNLVEMMNLFFSARILGIDQPSRYGSSWDRIFDIAFGWTFITTMTFNIPMAVMNAVTGTVNNYIFNDSKTALLGNRRYGAPGTDAHKKAMAILKGLKVVSINEDLTPYTNIRSQFNNAATYLIEKGEEFIQGSMFLGKIPQDVYDSMQVDANGKVTSIWTKEEQDDFVARTTKGITDIQGKYWTMDKRLYSTDAAMRLLGQFKTWFPDTMRNFFKAEEENMYGEKSKGLLRTTLGHLSTMKLALTTMSPKPIVEGIQYAKTNWNDSSNPDMVNMRRELKMMLFIGAMGGMYLLLKGEDDEEKKRGQYVMNLIRQIMVPFDFDNMLQLATLPATRTAGNLKNLFVHLLFLTEYERDSVWGEQGDIRFTDDIIKLLPNSQLIQAIDVGTGAGIIKNPNYNK